VHQVGDQPRLLYKLNFFYRIRKFTNVLSVWRHHTKHQITDYCEADVWAYMKRFSHYSTHGRFFMFLT